MILLIVNLIMGLTVRHHKLVPTVNTMKMAILELCLEAIVLGFLLYKAIGVI